MFPPILFLSLAALCAAVVSYGVHPNWAQFDHGLELIYWSRRLQWPLVAASLVLCMVIIALVAAGRRRVWWLIGLGPVLALFAHRFATGPGAEWRVVEEPQFTPASDVRTGVADDDYVVGLTFADQSYAYPFAALYNAPVVLQSDREKRMMLIWSAYANRAVAMTVDRQVRAREIDIVSTPANALLLYNTRFGQFVNGVTGQTPDGQRPTGVRGSIATHKATWAEWRRLRPDTKLMLPVGATGPTQPLVPVMPLPPAAATQPATRVAVVATTQPAAVAMDAVATATAPLNLMAGQTPVVLLGPRVVRIPRAFDRQVREDLFPQFGVTVPDEKRGPMLIDADSQSLWTLDGRATAGPLKGEQLRAVDVDWGLDWRVMKFWFPAMELVTPDAPPRITPQQKEGPEGVRPKPRRKRAGTGT